MPPAVDLIGKRFGSLVVTAGTAKRYHTYIVYRCRCDCGKTCEKWSQQLLRTKAISCGCQRNAHRRADLTGKRFGSLTAISATALRGGSGSIVWECRCDCGEIIHATAAALNYGRRTSCGCQRKKSGRKSK